MTKYEKEILSYLETEERDNSNLGIYGLIGWLNSAFNLSNETDKKLDKYLFPNLKEGE